MVKQQSHHNRDVNKTFFYKTKTKTSEIFQDQAFLVKIKIKTFTQRQII